MEIATLQIVKSELSLFQTYLLTNAKVKKINKEFDFYHVMFYREEYVKESIVTLSYPKANMFWYLDFEKYITEKFLKDPDCKYHDEWAKLLYDLKLKIHEEFKNYKWHLISNTNARTIVSNEIKYLLRDYQAYDLCQFVAKYNFWGKRGLILSDPRTGKTRLSLAAFVETAAPGDVGIVVCPKSAEPGWMSEINILHNPEHRPFTKKLILKMSDLKDITYVPDAYNIRIISYDMFKKLTIPQIRQLTSKNKHITLIVDEIHRLRNFKTNQSEAIFAFKKFCAKDKVDLGIIGLTGTIAVKEETDVFGTLCLINESKIKFAPYYDSFDVFKEYFYFCEDTSFGKIAKALRRESELNYLIQSVSVQTKQKDLEMFKGYTKTYKKVELQMDEEQRKIYDAVYNDMEYDEDIDCQNKLVQLVRLQQICIDPFGLVADYERLSPKIKWVVALAKKYEKSSLKFIVACKKVKPLDHLMKVFDTYGLKYNKLLGRLNVTERIEEIKQFRFQPEQNIMFLQLDTGRESLTLPEANAIIFLDRDFAQGFNEQAEARMTPIDGSSCTKQVIDLIMIDSKEEEIYQTLVIKKKSIDGINLIFKSRKGG